MKITHTLFSPIKQKNIRRISPRPSTIILICAILSIFGLVACNHGKDVTIFEIGDSREDVINTIAKDFTIEGRHWTRKEILDEITESYEGDWITLYECVYKGQEYYKVRFSFCFFDFQFQFRDFLK